MRGDMPCRRSFAFWKRWHPSGLHSARMLNAAALPLLVMLCLPLLCGCSAASSADSRTIPLSPILTSLRPVRLRQVRPETSFRVGLRGEYEEAAVRLGNDQGGV